MENQKHSEYMTKALREAFAKLGATSPNPAVGAVIVKDDTIISTGSTMACGLDHAEVVAINNAKGNLSGASMYVTLEPCCHYGKTPPCTSAIIQSGIKKVFIPLLDPNPAVAGKGVKALQEAGVEVVFVREFTQSAIDLLRPFKKSILRHRPFIIHKVASTLDGKTATMAGDSKWISSAVSRLLVHRLRACADTIIVGKSTVEADNPSLTVRYDDFSKDEHYFFEAKKYSLSGYSNSFIAGLLELWKPDVTHPLRKVVVGLPSSLNNLYVAKDANVVFFITDKEKDTLATRNDYTLCKHLLDEGKIIILQSTSRIEQIHELLDILYNSGSMITVLEGGATVAGSFFDANEIDQCMYFYSPILIGKGRSLMEGKGRQYIRESLSLHDITHIHLGQDICITGYKEPYQFEAL